MSINEIAINNMVLYMDIGRARWGASGALYLKPAIAGLKAFLRGEMTGRSRLDWP